jgi:SNF2 family DNA or RNA helicase
MVQWEVALRMYLQGKRELDVHVLSRYSKQVKDLGPGIFLAPHTILYKAGRKAYPSMWRHIWDVIVIDEAHRMRNRLSQSYRGASLLASRALFLLTGSPMENNPGDIWALLALVAPSKFRGFWDFVDEWMVTWSDPWKRHIVKVIPERQEEWDNLLAQYMIRRRREMVPVQQIDVPVRLPSKTQQAHASLKEEWILETEDQAEDIRIKSGGELVQKLRRLVSTPPEGWPNPKADAVDGILEDIPGNEPVVIFTWYRDSADMLGARIKDRRVVVIHGGIAQEDREYNLSLWRKDAAMGRGPVLIGTMKSVGEGLNLQEASHLILFEEDYLPGTMHQARGRVNRHGQQAEQITEYWVHAVNSVEDAVHSIQSRRGVNIQKALLEEVLSREW